MLSRQPRGKGSPFGRLAMVSARRHLPGLGVVLVFAGCAAVLFMDAFTEGKVFWEMDTLMFYYPIAVRIDQALAQGKLLLWTTSIFGGHPLLADGEAGMLYPINQILWWLLPAQEAFIFMRVVRFALTGIFTYSFLRALSLRRPASLLGGLSFAFGGFMIGQLQHANVSASLVWLPLAMRYAELAVQTVGRRRLVNTLLMGASLGMQALTVHINVALMTGLILASYVAYRCMVVPLPSIARTGRLLAKVLHQSLMMLGVLGRRAISAASILVLAAAVGIGLGAAQLLPLWELAQQSPRYSGVDYRFATSFAVPPLNLLTLVLPFFFRDARDLYWSPWFRWDTTIYVGIVPLVLALVAIFLRRSRLTAYFALLVLVGLFLSLGDYLPFKPYAWLWQLPLFSMTRVPSRFILFVNLGLAVLAAQGMDYLQTALAPSGGLRAALRSALRLPVLASASVPVPPARPRRYGVLVLIGLTLAFTGGLYVTLNESFAWVTAHPVEANTYLERYYPRGERNPVLDQPSPDAVAGLQFSLDVRSRWTERSLAWLALTGGLLALWYWLRAFRKLWPAALVLLLIVDLIAFGRDFHPRYGRDDLSPRSGLVQFLNERNGPHRVYAAWPVTAVGANRLLPFRIADAGGYSSLMTKRYIEFVGYGQRSSGRFLDTMNVRYVIASSKSAPDQTARAAKVFQEGDITVYERSGYLPRAYLVSEAKLASTDREALVAVYSSSFDLGRSVVLEGAGQEPGGQAEDRDSSSDNQADLLTYEPEYVRVATLASRPGYLVLADTYYPGWQATVDGKPAPIYRANYLFRAVPVPSGRHVVEFSYRPASVGLGGLITLLMGTAVVGFLLLAFLWRRAT